MEQVVSLYVNCAGNTCCHVDVRDTWILRRFCVSIWCKLKEELLDRALWRTGCGGGHCPVVRQTIEWMIQPTHYKGWRVGDNCFFNEFPVAFLPVTVKWQFCGRVIVKSGCHLMWTAVKGVKTDGAYIPGRVAGRKEAVELIETCLSV